MKRASAAQKPRKKQVEPTADAADAKIAPATFPIIGIGASAGGLAAFEAFLRGMPASSGEEIALVLVQHLSPDHRSILSELIQRCTKMEVHEVVDNMAVEPGHVYIIPPNKDMALLGSKLQLFEAHSMRGLRLPIDFFFRSLAADQRDRAICIVLSGTGSDGTLGLRAVKGEGGMAMVQEPQSAEFDGMPANAIATGLADYVLEPGAMPEQLSAYVHQVFGTGLSRGLVTLPSSPDVLAKICILLRAKTGHDFSQYKESTLIRRVQRRMALHQIESDSDYLRFMRQNSGEANALFRDLLIGVTSFFRDPSAFGVLETAAIPRLFEDVLPDGPIRVWVCGCSTGEEAYSIAILIQEHLEKVQRSYRVQIFATDIDRQAIDQARTGVFPASIAPDITPERLKRFFTRDSGGLFRIHKAVRDLLVFSEQDVLRDPPFSRLGLISCRNLFIYLNAELQKRLIPLFHYALNPEGLLFLGNSETIGDNVRLFELLDRKAKLYLRKPDVSGAVRPSLAFILPSSAAGGADAVSAREVSHPPKLIVRDVMQQALLRYFTQGAVLANASAEILYFHGRTGAYLEPAPGDATSNLLTMAREGLRHELTAAFHRAVTKKQPVRIGAVRVKTNGHSIEANIGILPVTLSGVPNLYLITFDEVPPLPRGKKTSKSVAGSKGAVRLTALERELRAKDEYIQTIIEEMETTNEELKSSNEEMQSINEEMQSSNEELETSKEELQSLNEELATVNAELQQKVSDLSRASNDMNNLLAGTGIGTLFVDHALRITRFTPAAVQIINLIPADIGRPLSHVVSNLVGYDRLAEQVQGVIETLVQVETEVQTKAGFWYILGIRPYRTLDNVIEGAVLTFVDVTDRKLAEQKLFEAERFRRASEIETVGIVFFKLDGPIVSANNAFFRLTGYEAGDITSGKLDWDILTPAEWLQSLHLAMKEIKNTGRSVPTERPYQRKDGSLSRALFAAWLMDANEAVMYVIEIAPKNSPSQMTQPSTKPPR